METARHRRSKSAAALEGNFQIQKQKTVLKSRSISSATTKEHVFTSELRQNSLKQGSGTPIKKLLAEEMEKENEVRRRQPSVIARLMGLDGLPSPQHGHKQQRRLLEKNQQQNAYIGIPQNEQPHDGRSCRMSSSDQQDFKDVYEDMEASHVMNHRCSSRWTANSRLPKPEMAHIQQKFMGAKCLSSNEELRASKELNDTLQILDSSKDLLLKYLEQPDSLFLKHFHDLQDDPSSSPYGCMASFERSNSEPRGNAKTWNPIRDGSYKRDISSRKKREDGLLLQSHSHHGSQNCCKASKSQSSVKDDINIVPTRIVVLKPNIVKRVNAVPSVSSPESSYASVPSLRKRLQYTGSETEDVLSCRKKNSSREVCFSKANSREDRDISKEITRQMREHFRPSSGLIGYAGDESSYDAYESDSSSASELMTLTSRSSFEGNNWVTHSSSNPCESLVSREAKKRLSERWKMTHKCQSMEPIVKGSTLAEMLAVPERDSVHQHFDATMVLDGASQRFAGSSDSSGWNGPLGISSRDGWKDGYNKTSSRAKSLPSSPVGRRSRRREPLGNDLVKMEKTKGRNKSRKGNHNKEEDCSVKNDRFSNRKSRPCPSKCSESCSSSPDVNSSQIQTDINSCQEFQQENNFVHSQAPHITDSCRCFSTDVPENAKSETLTLSFNESTDLCPKHNDSLMEHEVTSAHNQEDVNLEESAVVKSEEDSTSLKCAGPEPESCESFKDADHCSPVSVLEVSFAEDVSSSPDCFEAVNAEINELRMKLQLLKMESGADADTPMLFSSNEDFIQQQPEKGSEEKRIVGGDRWESSYIVDVLLYSGLKEFDPETLDFTSWHSSEYPIGRWVFNSLEKKYNGGTTECKFERRLLFDRMNVALLEMFQQYVDQSPWVQPRMIGVSKWQKYGLNDYLQESLVHQENQANGDRPENVLDREMQWLGCWEDIDTIGKDVEKLLIDDLIGELIAAM